ncbi:MAG: hypothetical protein WC315_00520 [Candidatus Omnitrophota bacterium]|jgi:hypothetical protein
MLRLAHRILSQRKNQLPDAYKPEMKEVVGGIWNSTQKVLTDGQPIIIADNIAEYVNNLYADTATAPTSYHIFPPCPPPFKSFFIEWNCPPGIRYPGTRTFREHGYVQVGCQIETFDSRKNSRVELDDLRKTMVDDKLINIFDSIDWRWFLIGISFACLRDGRAVPVEFTEIFLDEDGNYMQALGYSLFEFCRNESTPMLYAEAIVMQTLAFMQCKNVNTIDVTESEGPERRWCRRQRVPELKYQMLQIDPNSTRTLRRGQSESNESNRAFHICRGHFAHYEDDGVSKGLFGQGRYGTFWIPSHIRGSLENGRIINTYNVLAP